MALKKPSNLFEKKEVSIGLEVSSNISESYDKFRSNFDKVNELSERVEILSQQLSEKLNKTELENAMLSQLMILDENFKSIQNQIKGLNKEDLKEFRETVYNLTKLVGNILDNEIPRYQKQITRNEIVIGEKVCQIEEVLEERISNIRNETNIKIDNIAEVIDNNLEYFNQQIEENTSQVKETKKVYSNLSKILENKVHTEDKKFEEYSYIIEGVQKTLAELKIQFFSVDNYLEKNHQELLSLKEEVFSEIEKLSVGDLQENIKRLEKKIDFIRETYSKIEPEVVIKEVIQEGLSNISPEDKNTDPLTPLNQNFVTLDQLQDHYRLFINRIQQQLSTVGGGGETQLKYLDDVVGIATNASSYDGKFLKYDHSQGKFEFVTVSGGGSGISTYSDIAGISTVSEGLTGTPNIVVGIVTSSISIPTELRTKSVAEKTTLVSGNTVGLAFTTGSGNVAICTNPSGDITLNVTDIPTDSSFDNHSISFSVIVTQTGTARTCTAVNLNGVSRTIRWSNGSLANAISGVTTSNGYDIFTFTGINTVGSASTTANYVVLGSVNGGFN